MYIHSEDVPVQMILAILHHHIQITNAVAWPEFS